MNGQCIRRVGALRWAAWSIIAVLCWILVGCADVRYYNTVAMVDKRARVHDEAVVAKFLKNNIFYPVRDVFDPYVWGALLDRNHLQAMNVDRNGNVPDGSFYTNRGIAQISPEQAGRGAAAPPAPKAPWTVVKHRRGKRPLSFVGEDATGRRFMVKLDDPDCPQARSAAAVISSRVLWLLGYHVPANYVVTIDGTGVAEYDGRRAEASLYIPGDVLGHYKFDWLRHRREVRALRLVSAWLDDLDRADNNTLATFCDGATYYYLIDFDSTLGLWQGRPKRPWQGHRYLLDPLWAIGDVFSLGALSRARIRYREAVSKAVGLYRADDFDPMTWKPNHPNSAFRFITRADRNWMIQKIAAITPEQLKAIVDAAEFSNLEDHAYLLETLLNRRAKITELADDDK